MKKQLSLVLAIFLILGVVAFYFIYQDRKDNSNEANAEDTSEDSHSDEFHLHAAFKIIKDEKTLDFTDGKYMYYKPCGGEESEMTTIQDRVHLHNFVGDVTHVHAEGITWRNLFESLNLDQPTEYIGFLNGEKVENLLDKEISAYDRVLFVVGEISATINVTELQNTIPTIERMKEVEKQVENCGKK